MSNVNFVQLQKNIEKYGLEPAMKWAEQFPNTIDRPLGNAFDWSASKEGYKYWLKVEGGALDGKPTNPTPPTSSTPKATTNKPKSAGTTVLPFEEEILRRLAERKATNIRNRAIHEKALELAEASKKKLAKKLLKLMKEGADTE